MFQEPQLHQIWSALIFIIGLIFGSFANVLIHRLPQKKSIVKPASNCPHCATPIAFYDNIPIISYILLKGKCRNCGARISFRYPLVEAVTGILFLGAFLKFGSSWEFPLFAAFFFILIVHAFIDYQRFLLLDSLNIAGAVIGIVGLLLIPTLSIIDGLFGAAFGGGLMLLVYSLGLLLFKRRGMGPGDIKTAAVIGLYLGPIPVIHMLLGASIIGLIWGLGRMLTGKGRMVQFGTLMAASAVIMVLAGWA